MAKLLLLLLLLLESGEAGVSESRFRLRPCQIRGTLAKLLSHRRHMDLRQDFLLSLAYHPPLPLPSHQSTTHPIDEICSRESHCQTCAALSIMLDIDVGSSCLSGAPEASVFALLSVFVAVDVTLRSPTVGYQLDEIKIKSRSKDSRIRICIHEP